MTNTPVLTVAERLLDPMATTQAVGDADVTSLSHGLAGTALLHSRLSTIDPAFATAAVHHWTQAAAHLRHHHSNEFTGIQGGQGALAASLIIGTAYLPDPEPLRTITARSATWLSARAVDVADQHRASATTTGAHWHTYDAITGLAGTGRVLLAASQHGYTDVEPGLTAALETLTAILAPTEYPRPGWWLSADGHPASVDVDTSGAATTGLAHGVAGPLAFLATAHAAGQRVRGQADAITHAASWLLTWRDPNGSWPPNVTGTELDNHVPPQQPGRRHAWCYGTPGISRALTLAGRALGDSELLRAADQAMASLAHQPPELWDVEGPTLCHGYAGVLQAASESSAADAVASTVTSFFDRAQRFGFQHHAGNTTVDSPGFLTGAAGVALALADHSGLPTASAATSWDALLLLT